MINTSREMIMETKSWKELKILPALAIITPVKKLPRKKVKASHRHLKSRLPASQPYDKSHELIFTLFFLVANQKTFNILVATFSTEKN